MRLQIVPHLLPAILLMSGLAVSENLRAAEKVLVSDDFTPDAKERPAGVSLNGFPVQEGKGMWKVPMWDNTVITEKGVVTNADASQERAVQGLVAINDPSHPITVQARVTTETAGWVSVGIQSDPSVTWFDGRSLLFALLEPKGQWALFKNVDNTQVKIASGPVDNYSSTKPAILALTYDPADASAVVSVDGKNVSGKLDTGIETSVEIASAGFYIYTFDTTVPGEATVDDFKVSISK